MVGAHVDVERLVAMQQGQVHQAAAVQRVGVTEGVAQPGSHGGLGVAVGAQVDVARLELGIRVQPLVRRTVRLAEAQTERLGVSRRLQQRPFQGLGIDLAGEAVVAEDGVLVEFRKLRGGDPDVPLVGR